MALRQNKEFSRVGLAEFVAVLLMTLAAVAVTLWWQGRRGPEYLQAEGRVLEGNAKLTHYNATDMRQKVTITYEYMAAGNTYTGSWSGFWPEDDSPNALPSDRFQELCVRGHPLVVMYDPEDPSTSILHPPGRGAEAFRQGFAMAGCALAILYCAILYPAWRLRS